MLLSFIYKELIVICNRHKYKKTFSFIKFQNIIFWWIQEFYSLANLKLIDLLTITSRGREEKDKKYRKQKQGKKINHMFGLLFFA